MADNEAHVEQMTEVGHEECMTSSQGWVRGGPGQKNGDTGEPSGPRACGPGIIAQVIFRARIEETENGEYIAWCDEPTASAHGISPTNALDRLRAELRYQIELCPCSGVDDNYIELQTEG